MSDMLGPYQLDSIITGDARQLAQAIPDASVDLIFTDPVYDRIDDYRWLAETAARVLKPDRACLVYCANMRLAEVIDAMKPLTYAKTLCYHIIKVIAGVPVHKRDSKCNSAWTPCVWFEKGQTAANGRMFDIIITSWGNSQINHKWAKDEKIAEWIRPLTDTNAIVWDPFAGGGTVPAVCKILERRYLAFEIDPATAAKARQRVADTLPLFDTAARVSTTPMFTEPPP
jgi:hypothetical protein